MSKRKSKNADVSLMLLKLEQFRRAITSWTLLRLQLMYGEGGYTRYGVGMVRRLFPILSYKTTLMVAQWIVAERLIVPKRQQVQ